MRTQNYFKILKSRSGNELTMVHKPDHPFIFHSPDILIGYKGLLTALFFPNNAEEKDVDKLLARMAMSKLALPDHIKCILVVSSKQVSLFEKDLHQLHNNFHEILDVKKLNDAIKIATDKNFKSNFLEIPREIRLKTNFRNQIFLFESQKIISRDSLNSINKKEFSNVLAKNNAHKPGVLSWVDNIVRKNISRDIYEINNTVIAIRNFKNSQNAFNKLKSLFIFSTLNDFVLDNGIPYFKSNQIKFINVDEVPLMYFDPYKPIRVCSFTGWILVNTYDLNSINKIKDKLLDKYNERI